MRPAVEILYFSYFYSSVGCINHPAVRSAAGADVCDYSLRFCSSALRFCSPVSLALLLRGLVGRPQLHNTTRAPSRRYYYSLRLPGAVCRGRVWFFYYNARLSCFCPPLAGFPAWRLLVYCARSRRRVRRRALPLLSVSCSRPSACAFS